MGDPGLPLAVGWRGIVIETGEQRWHEIAKARADPQIDFDAAAVKLVHFAGRRIHHGDLRSACEGGKDAAGDVLRQAAAKAKDQVRILNRKVAGARRSEEHTSELQSRQYLVCRLLLEKKKNTI